MNAVLNLLRQYDEQAGLEGEVSSEPIFSPNLETFCLHIKKTSPVWQVSFKGFNAQGHYSSRACTLVVLFSHDNFPPFSLDFQEPLPSRTYVALPGGNLILQFSSKHEVGVSVLEKSKHTSGMESEINRIVSILCEVSSFPEEQYLQSKSGVPGQEGEEGEFSAFHYEVCAAKCDQNDEAYVRVNMHRVIVSSEESNSEEDA